MLPKWAGPGRRAGCGADAEGAPGPHGGCRAAPESRRGAPRKQGPRRPAGPRRRAREPAPRPFRQPCASAACGAERGLGQACPGRRRRACRRSQAWDHAPADKEDWQRRGHSRMIIQDRKRRQAGPTGAQPPNAGQFPRLAECQCGTGSGLWQAMRPQARGMRTEPHPEIRLEKASGLCGGWRAEHSGALESSCYAPDHEHQENCRIVAIQAFRTNFIKKGPVNCL